MEDSQDLDSVLPYNVPLQTSPGQFGQCVWSIECLGLEIWVQESSTLRRFVISHGLVELPLFLAFQCISRFDRKLTGFQLLFLRFVGALLVFNASSLVFSTCFLMQSCMS